MKVFKILKYAFVILLFVIATSFTSEKVFSNLEGGESKTETPIVID